MCLLLSFLSRTGRLFFPERRARKVKRILVTKYFGMGSILLSVPLFEALRREYPGARIGFLTFSGNGELCGVLSPADEYYFLRTGSLPIFLRDLLAVLSRIRRREYDMCVDMEFFSNFSMIVSVLSGARERVGYYARRPGRESLLTRPVYFNQGKHAAQVFLSLCAKGPQTAFQRNGHPPVRLSADEDARRSVSALLRRIAAGNGDVLPMIAVNVNAGELCLERRWPGEYFVSLSGRILTDTRAVLVFLGGGEDREYVGGVVSSVRKRFPSDGRVHDLSGALSIRELIAVLKGCEMLITNDSGPLHLAVCAGVRTVSFFGPETPSLYGPLGRGHIVFYKGLYCSPCLNVYNAKTAMCNGDNRCMSAISPDEVYETIKGCLPRARRD